MSEGGTAWAFDVGIISVEEYKKSFANYKEGE